MAVDKPVKLAILWHMHQPNYQEPNSRDMVMPWVRLHALKDYLDMPLLAGRYERVKVTFNLVPSLLDQLDLYLAGGSDPHLRLSRLAAERLTEGQRVDILKSFFSANPSTMIEPYPRFRELYKKAKDNFGQAILPALFSSEELRDLQVWSNLAWIDPAFRSEEPVRTLLAKGRHFTEEDKQQLLDWQLTVIKRIIPTYRELYERGRIDISFTPYYHPILPLLCDTNVAREAIPNISLPEKRFVHPEDARMQVEMSIKRFEALFGKPLAGMWPSEGSVSDEVAEIIGSYGVKWMATDEEVLFHSLRKTGVNAPSDTPHAVYEYPTGLKLFFRDHHLSDRIGFVYSGMDAERAVEDFINNIKTVRKQHLDDLDNTVISVILDGENAWEYFPDDGREFLEKFYQRLNDDPLIESITMSEATKAVKARPLKALFAGSWIHHNFRIWIGHHEDNAAWALLTKTRDRLVEFQKERPNFDADKIRKAWRQIYIAEGSDWCWWYGDEHRGPFNEEFDKVFRRHLIAVYEYLGLDIPFDLLNPIYQSLAAVRSIPPDQLVTPDIDGRVSHFYEWAGAGYYDCLKGGGAMHRVERLVSVVYFAFDHDNVYIRLDFVDKKPLQSVKKLTCRLTLFTPEVRHVHLDLSKIKSESGPQKEYCFALGNILEVALARSFVFPKGYGSLGFLVTLMDGQDEIEVTPESEPIKLTVQEPDSEMFWPA